MKTIRDYLAIHLRNLDSSEELDLDQPVLTAAEAAARFGLAGASMVIRLAREGELPHVKFEEPLLIPLDEAEAWYRRFEKSDGADVVARGRERVVIMEELLETLPFTRKDLIEWANDSVKIEKRPRSRKTTGRPRAFFITQSAREDRAKKIILEEIEQRPESLKDLLVGLERFGIRETLEELGHGRAFDLLDELEEGLDIERMGPARPSGTEFLELPGVWEEIEAWVEDLQERARRGGRSKKSRLESELADVQERLDHFSDESPMLLVNTLTLVQLKSLASWLDLSSGSGRDDLIDGIVEELGERYMPEVDTEGNTYDEVEESRLVAGEPDHTYGKDVTGDVDMSPLIFSSSLTQEDFRQRMGRAVRDRREELGMSIEEVGAAAQVEPSRVERLEIGEELPSIEDVVYINAALEMSPADLRKGLSEERVA